MNYKLKQNVVFLSNYKDELIGYTNLYIHSKYLHVHEDTSIVNYEIKENEIILTSSGNDDVLSIDIFKTASLATPIIQKEEITITKKISGVNVYGFPSAQLTPEIIEMIFKQYHIADVDLSYLSVLAKFNKKEIIIADQNKMKVEKVVVPKNVQSLIKKLTTNEVAQELIIDSHEFLFDKLMN